MNVRTYGWAVMIFALVTLQSACAVNARTVRVSIEDDASTLHLRSGDTVVVALSLIAGTGHRWTVAQCDTNVLKPAGEKVRGPQEPLAMGDGGTQELTFHASRPGTANLVLRYATPGSRGEGQEFRLVAQVADGAAKGAARTIDLEEDDNGKTLRAQTNDTVVISLRSNPSTGYRWEIAENNDDVLKRSGDEMRMPPEARHRIGAGGTQVLTFTAAHAGRSIVVLKYRRPNGTHVPQVFRVTVNVDDPKAK